MKALFAALALLATATFASAQMGMPDARQMSGMPLPMGDMTPGTVTVRVVRGNVSKTIPNQKVELTIGSETRTAQTDESGRATFENLTIGGTVKVRSVVGSETLDSQEFQVPPQGGVRIMLVASDGAAGQQPGQPGAGASAPAQPGAVTLGSQSRIHVELGEESADVYYLLEITNPGKSPVQPTTPFELQLPDDATGSSILEGSSPNATAAGGKVTVRGPFTPGATTVQVAYRLPYSGSGIEFRQGFPAAFDQPLISITRKLPSVNLVSSIFHDAREMVDGGQVLLVAHGRTTPANTPLDVRIEGVPMHPAWPRYVALVLAGLVLVAGAYGAATGSRRVAEKSAAARQLESRREKLLSDLAVLEQRHRSGSVPDGQYDRRRAEIVEALERVYGDLDGSAAA